MTRPLMLLLLAGITGITGITTPGCGPRDDAAGVGPRRPSPPPTPAVDCPAYCGRLYLCFDDFMVAADPRARQKLERMKRSGVYSQIRRTTLGACKGECRRAAYRGEAARMVNGCLAAPDCAGFGRCVMSRIYRVDCHRLCRRAWVSCLEELLVSARSLRRETIAVLRKRHRLKGLGAQEYVQCMVECRKRSGHGPNALGINLCLRRPKCPTFATCLRGFLGAADPALQDCARLYDRYLRCRHIPMTRGRFLTLCGRLRKRPHLRAEIRCANETACPKFEACLKRIPSRRPTPAPPRKRATPPRPRPGN